MFYLDKNTNGELVFQELPFKSKYDCCGKLYRKKHGFRHTLTIGESSIEIECPYDRAKINAVEFKWFPEGVTADFFILDSIDGIYQQYLGVPAENIVSKAPITQHGFGATISKGHDKDVSEYDAGVMGGMFLKIVFNNQSTEEKEVGINVPFHEVVIPPIHEVVIPPKES